MMQVFSQVWDSLLAHEKSMSLILITLMLVAMVFETAGVGLIIPYVTYLVNPELIKNLDMPSSLSNFINYNSQYKILLLGMIFLCTFYFIKNLFLAYFVWWQTKFATNIHVSLSNRLFKKYLSKPYDYHLDTNSSMLIRNVSKEAGRFQSTLASSITIASELFIIISMTTLLLFIEPFGLIVTFLVMTIAILFYYILTRKIFVHWGRSRLYHEGESIKHLVQGLSGIKDIKILNREENFLSNFEYHNREYSKADRWYNTFQLLPKLWLETLAVIMLSLLILLMSSSGKDGNMIIPILAAFAAAAFRLLPSMNRILISFQTLRYSIPSISIIHSELKSKEEVNNIDFNSSTEALKFNEEIKIDNVSFAYQRSESSNLNSINLSIRKNQFVGFVGTSGAGKSTLVDLILGLLTPNSGKITVDGININESFKGWQKLIGYVPQEIYLTDDTIEKNIAFGIKEKDINQDLLKDAVNAAQIGQFIDSLPNREKTMVGERGVRLSGGQLQRIGIARALYNKPSILMLDEATSALDAVTEQKVMEGINKLKGSITIIIISHRLSTVERCDKVIKIEKGKLI